MFILLSFPVGSASDLRVSCERRGAILVAALSLAAGACSTLTTDVSECESTAQCRDAFGFGSVCSANGYCETAAENPRCTHTFPEDLLDQPSTKTVVLGGVMDRSVGLFEDFEKSARLALKQANDQGGVGTMDFGIVFCTAQGNFGDGLSPEDASVETARFLVDTYAVPAIFGPASSTDTQAVFLEVGPDGVLVISPSATSPALTDLDPDTVDNESPGLLWRTAPPDSFQGQAIAFDMAAPGTGRIAPVTKVAAIHEQGPYGAGLVQVFASEFQAAGGTVTLLPFATTGERDSQITAAGLDPSFDEVLFVSSEVTDVVAFLNIAASIGGYDGKGLFLSDAAATDDVVDVADSRRFPQVRATRPQPLDPTRDLVYATFLASFLSEYGTSAEGQVFTANAYDAGWMLAYGVTWALLQEDELSGTTIARGMRRVSGGTGVEVGPLSWATVQQQFGEGNGIDIDGASGPLDIDPGTEETTANIDVWHIVDGQIESIYTWPP